MDLSTQSLSIRQHQNVVACHITWYQKDAGALHHTHGEIHRRVAESIGKYDTLLEIIKKTKHRWYGHVARSKESWETPSSRVKSKGKDHEEGLQDSVKEWTRLSLKVMWREPEDEVA